MDEHTNIGTNTERERASGLSRRGFVHAAVGVGALGAVPRVTRATHDARATAEQIAVANARHDGGPVEDRFDRIVDLRAAGADSTGTVPVDSVLSEYVADDTLVLVPDGRYAVKQVGFYKVRNWGLVGVGDDVTLVPTDDYVQDVWQGGYKSRDIWFENLTLDITSPNHSPGVALVGYGETVYRDVRVKGFYNDPDVVAFVFRPMSGGTMLAENLRLPDGGDNVGIYMNHRSGSVTIRDCHVEGFWNNGVYASSATAPVYVEGGLFKNNNVANIRIGSDGSRVRGATVVVDSDTSGRHFRESSNMRGIRISHGPRKGGRCYIEDCEVSMTGGRGVGGVVSAPTAGSYEVRNTRIHIGDGYKVDGTRSSSFGISVDNAQAYDNPTWGGHVGNRLFENVSITGDAGDFMAVRFQRGNNTLRNVCIQQTSGDRDGLDFQQGTGNRVEDCTINVSGEAVTGAASVSGLRTDGTCPLPTIAPEDTQLTDDTGQSAYGRHTIPGRIQAEAFDRGGEGVAYHDTSDGNTGGVYRDEDVDIEYSSAPDGTPSLGWIEHDEWLEYTVDARSGVYTLGVNAAGWSGPGSVVVTLDGVELARVRMPDTGNWRSWQTVFVPDVVVPMTGASTLNVRAVGSDFNLNWIEFEE